MSEIFDFLKKTETERKHKVLPPEGKTLEPAGEQQDSQIEDSPAFPVIEESPAKEALIYEDDKLDLTGASQQVKSIMDPFSLVGEQFRLLRSRLGLMQKQRDIKTVLITSTAPEEGKTFTAAGLVGVFAQEPGKRVLLIDADMRKPKSGWNLGLNGSGVNAGLSEVLRGKIPFQKALLTFTNPEFSFLPSGSLPSNPSELLCSPILENLLKTAGESFDWIVLDSPPIHSISDTTILVSLCDTVILVVRANSTPARLVEESIDRIGRDRICGVVLNRQKQMHTSRYYYRYYYRKSER